MSFFAVTGAKFVVFSANDAVVLLFVKEGSVIAVADVIHSNPLPSSPNVQVSSEVVVLVVVVVVVVQC